MVKVYREKRLSPAELRRKAFNETFRRARSIVPIWTVVRYLIFTIFAINFFRALRIRYFSQTGDAAGYVDVLSNTSDPDSLHFAYGIGLQLIHKMVVLGNAFSCPTSILPGVDANFFYYHAYIIGFVFRYFSALFPDPTIPTLGLLSISVAMGLFAIFDYLRAKKFSVFFSTVFLLFVLFSPLLYQGLSWNPYINRLFFGPAIYVVLGLLRGGEISRLKYVKIFLAAVFCITLSERSSLYIGIAILLCLIYQGFNQFKIDFYRITLVLISVVGVVWYFIWVNLISLNNDYSAGSLANMFANFNSAMAGSRLSSFMVLVTVLLPFLFLASTSFKLLLIISILLLPIITVKDSTANLDSFYAHYQSDFFPLIIAFAVVGLSNMKNLRIWKISLSLWLIVSLASLSVYHHKNYPDSNFVSSISKGLPNVINTWGFYYLPNSSDYARSYLQNRESVNAVFNQVAGAITNVDSSISVPEELMPALIGSGRTNIDYYPVGVGTNEYVIASYLLDSPNRPDVSIFGSVPSDLRPIWSGCIQRVLDSKYKPIGNWRTGGGVISLYHKTAP